MRVLSVRHRSVFVAIAASVCVACAGRTSAAANEPPRIDAVHPDTVDARSGAIVEVVVSGRGFAPGTPGTNTLEIAGARLTSIPANAKGTELRFVVPDVMPSNSEAPPQRIPGGTYSVRVITGAGTSNAVQLTVVR